MTGGFMITIKDILARMNKLAPTQIAYSWDNVGLMVGEPDWQVRKILLTLDVTKAAITKAIAEKADLIISHHPFIFRPIKSVTDPRIIKLIENKIGVISFHTNLDLVNGGVNTTLAQKLELCNLEPLAHESGTDWLKFELYVPEAHLESIRNALTTAGAGRIGMYDNCSASWEVEGSYRPLAGSKPFAGNEGEISHEREIKLEFMAETFRRSAIETSIKSNHPYEQPVYTITKVENPVPTYSLGIIGSLEAPLTMLEFSEKVKDKLSAKHVRLWTAGKDCNDLISRVAVCGGSGTSIIGKVLGRADLLVTADLTYHTILDSQLPLIDAGHLYTEYPILEQLADYLADAELEFVYLTLNEHEFSGLMEI
jgi:dinuclear metal center YbgI/SA1388 family protein